MRKRLACLLLAISCLALFAAGDTLANGATVKPLLCETSCGGSWGAKEHALAYAKEAWPNHNAQVGSCEYDYTNQRGVTQWTCYGEYVGYQVPWKVGVDPYGYKTTPVEFN